jgi:hypothetical protein
MAIDVNLKKGLIYYLPFLDDKIPLPSKAVETESVYNSKSCKRSFWQRFLSLFKKNSVEGGSEKLKNSLSSTLQRSKSVKTGNENLVNPVAILSKTLSLKRNHTKTYRNVLEQVNL